MTSGTAGSPTRRLAAILFADVYGYSRQMGLDEEGTYRRVARSMALFRSLVGDYGGEVIDAVGDRVLALFESAEQALRFAVEIQRELRNDVWHESGEPLRYRIGIHQGEIIVDERHFSGNAINIAARLEALAQPGGICISEAVKRAAQDPMELRVRSLGRPSLKNIPERMEVFAVHLDGEPAAAPPPVVTPSTRLSSELLGAATLVVLPLENQSGDAADRHICDGITGDVITNLSRFQDLLVIARHSAFMFKSAGHAVQDAAERLGVEYAVTGGIQRAGGRIRLHVRLIEAGSGRVLWSERFEGALAELFDFQDEVTALIAARLELAIRSAEQERLASRGAPDLRAYGLVLRAEPLAARAMRETNLHARRLLEEAAQVDPGYARSFAALSRVMNDAWRHGWAETAEAALEQAVELAQQAIGVDPMDTRGHAALGHAYVFLRRYDDSLAAYERAADLNPNDADVLADMAHCVSACGDAERALRLVTRAMRLNPYVPDRYLWNLGEIYFDLERYEDAIRTLDRMQDKSEAYRLLAASHALLGHEREAWEHGRQVLVAQPGFSLERWQAVPPDRNQERLERYVEGLRKAGLG